MASGDGLAMWGTPGGTRHRQMLSTSDRPWQPRTPCEQLSCIVPAGALTRRVQWDTDFPEPGRFGSLAGYQATTAVFAADSEAALAELAVSVSQPTVDRQALTAASMVDLVTAVVGNPLEALRWVVSRTRAHRPPRARSV